MSTRFGLDEIRERDPSSLQRPVHRPFILREVCFSDGFDLFSGLRYDELGDAWKL